jgi:hypothetical protein
MRQVPKRADDGGGGGERGRQDRTGQDRTRQDKRKVYLSSSIVSYRTVPYRIVPHCTDKFNNRVQDLGTHAIAQPSLAHVFRHSTFHIPEGFPCLSRVVWALLPIPASEPIKLAPDDSI